MGSIKKLLFVDANIWLDFYRSRNSDVGLARLHHLESVVDRIVVTHVLEMEYKKNRQLAIAEGLKGLVVAPSLPTYGIFSDAQAAKMLEKNLRAANTRVRKLKDRLIRALNGPTHHDPVYKACQRIFHRNSKLVLGLDNKRKVGIRRKAVRRFYLGCPPRKPGDTSLGDAINWEWMVACAIDNKAELVIVSRDSDYGIDIEGKVHLNDHLAQEFSERVSKKREVLLYRSLSKALKDHFEVKVSKQELDEEEQRLTSANPSFGDDALLRTLSPKTLEEFERILREARSRTERLSDDWLALREAGVFEIGTPSLPLLEEAAKDKDTK